MWQYSHITTKCQSNSKINVQKLLSYFLKCERDLHMLLAGMMMGLLYNEFAD